MEDIEKDMKEFELLYRAIDVYGPEKQQTQFIEESIELCLEILHLQRGRGDIKKAIEEIVDVDICLVQLKLMVRETAEYFKLNYEDIYNSIYDEKIKRLEERVSKAEKDIYAGEEDEA